jgi:hypothetical protein
MLLNVELNRVISEDEVILTENRYTSIIIWICRVTLVLIYGYNGTFRPRFRYTSRIKNNVAELFLKMKLYMLLNVELNRVISEDEVIHAVKCRT